MVFTRVLGDTTYQTGLFPTLLVAALMLGHLALVAIALRRALGKVVGGIALGGYLGAALIVGVIWLQADGFDGTPYFVRRVFWPLLLVDTTGMAMGIASALGALWLIKRAGWAGAVAVLTGLGLFGGYSHWEDLNRYRVLPVASFKGPPFFHIGRERSVAYRLAFGSGYDFPNFEGWQLTGPQPLLRADRPQSFPLVVRATAKAVQLETRLLMQAVEDRQEDSPLLPLAVGNTWELAVDSRCKFESGRVTREHYKLFLRITGVEDSDGLHQYKLQQGIDIDVNQTVASLFAAGGATYFVDTDGRTEHPIEALAGGACRLNLFDVQGRCIHGKPGSDIALSGPLGFTRDANLTGAGRVAIGILTLGFSRPEPRQCVEDYELVRSFVTAGPAK